MKTFKIFSIGAIFVVLSLFISYESSVVYAAPTQNPPNGGVIQITGAPPQASLTIGVSGSYATFNFNSSSGNGALPLAYGGTGRPITDSASKALFRNDVLAAQGNGQNDDITSMSVLGSITAGTSAGAAGVLMLNAGGTNQNIVLTPSGTGSIVLNGNINGGTTAAFGIGTTSTNGSSFAAGHNSTASGADGIALGVGATASGYESGAFGTGATASGNYAIAVATDGATASGSRSFAVGHYVTAGTAIDSMIIGTGVDNVNRLVNNTANSLMIGFNSTVPTLFIGTSAGAGTTGNVGIGTSTPGSPLEVNGAIKLSGATATYKITNVADPTSAQDVATKNYVDAAAGGTTSKSCSYTTSGATATVGSACTAGGTTFTPPSGVSLFWVTLVGSGGGGGGGGTASSSSNSCGGGGGGGGAMVFKYPVNVSAASYTVSIGAGGTGGAQNVDGNAGNQSSLVSVITVNGGSQGLKAACGSGGLPSGGDGGGPLAGSGGNGSFSSTSAPTNGGNGTSNLFILGGAGGGGGATGSFTGAAGGVSGAAGGTSATRGGGGGGGSFGLGGNGGAGGNPGLAGAVGTKGGGGGGGGGSSVSNGTGGTGGTGGGGYALIEWVGP